jgi:hypothetical protein
VWRPYLDVLVELHDLFDAGERQSHFALLELRHLFDLVHLVAPAMASSVCSMGRKKSAIYIDLVHVGGGGGVPESMQLLEVLLLHLILHYG